MSINSAMQAGVSGLTANASALAAISDNIVNVNTTAYKRTQVDFSTLVASQAQGGRYTAGGVTGVNSTVVSQQGSPQQGVRPTDLYIAGSGMFVVTTKAAGLTAADSRLFTRAGDFQKDEDGFLVNKAGLYLQGWPVRADGTFDSNPSDLNQLGPINVANLGAVVEATTRVGLTANLNKDTIPSPTIATYSAAGPNSMTDYAATPSVGTAKPDFTMDSTLIDSQGGSHRITMAFLKSATNPNEWNAEIYAVPASDVTTAGAPAGQLAKGLVKFNQDGSINLATSTLFGAAGAPPTLTLGASGTAGAPRWSNALGISAQTIDIDISSLTQKAAASAPVSTTSNGAGVGNVTGVSVGEDGIVSALFDNGQIRSVAKLAVATFPNPDGLQAVSGNAYRLSRAAGDLTLKAPGEGGAGIISPSALEASTVDLSAEFTSLIQTQKSYSASSKIITTADQMLSELINIIR